MAIVESIIVLMLGNDADGSDERNVRKSSDVGSYFIGETREETTMMQGTRRTRAFSTQDVKVIRDHRKRFLWGRAIMSGAVNDSSM